MIRTERLVLRAPDMADLDALHAVFSHPDAMQYWSHEAHETRAKTRETLHNMILSHADTGAEYVIAYQGKVIGKAGCWKKDEVGYILHPDYWRRGFAFEALRAILPVVFAAHPDLGAITAEIDPRNTGSQVLLRKLGFRETGRAENTIKVAGEWCDSTYFALARPETAPRPG